MISATLLTTLPSMIMIGSGKDVGREGLDDVMRLDHVVIVHANGTVSDAPYPGVWPPEMHVSVDCNGQSHDEPEGQEDLWALQTGWTGQFGYSGALMHSSEYVGGGLAEHILDSPGLWCAVVVSVLDCGCDPEKVEDGHEGLSDEPAGWALVHWPMPA